MKESDLYEPIKEYFEEMGYEVFSEVIVRFAGGRVDVVAYLHPAPVAVEMKTTLSIDLVEQAFERKNVFPLVYIAIPERRKEIAFWLQKHLRDHGIGILEVGPRGIKVTQAARYKKPLMQGRVKWDETLLPEHKTWLAGGSAGGGYVTPYRLTMTGVRHFLSQARRQGEMHMKLANRETLENPNLPSVYNGWRTVKEILDHCETHYRTPKSSLAQSLMNFEAEWCEVKKEKGRLWFRHKG